MSENTAVQGPEFAVLLGMPVVIRSEAMRQVMQLVQRVAQTTASVLITGESGAGKELIARALHQFSLRCNMPWVDVNCGALPEHLMESELFGYEKGDRKSTRLNSSHLGISYAVFCLKKKKKKKTNDD